MPIDVCKFEDALMKPTSEALSDATGSAFEKWWNGRLRECPDGGFIKAIAREAWDAAHSRQTFEVEKHKQVIRSICQIQSSMSDLNVDSFDKYKTALRERIEVAEDLLSQNVKGRCCWPRSG